MYMTYRLFCFISFYFVGGGVRFGRYEINEPHDQFVLGI